MEEAGSGGLSDDALLAGFALGDPDASRAFVERFARRVFGVAVRVVGDATLADDVAQQAFERAWRHAGAYDPLRASVATWLLAITRNVAIDETRRRRVVPVDVEDLVGLTSGEDGDPARAATTSDSIERVRRRLAGLSVEQRRAVLLATWYGRTAAEIARIEDIPLGTAKTRVRDGLRRLRAQLGVDRGAGR